MIVLSMTRWELIQAFHRLAKILFVDGYREEEEVMLKVKTLVIDVLTETQSDGQPLKFGAVDDDTKGA